MSVGGGREQEILDRLEVLEARQEIAELYAKYYWLIDTRDWGTISTDIFTEDAELNFGKHGADPTGLRALGAEGIARAFADEIFGDLEATAHYAANVAVELRGSDEATGRRYVQSWHWEPAVDGSTSVRPVDFVGVGVLIDTLRKVDGSWRIVKSERRSLGPSPFGLGSPPDSLFSRVFGDD